MQKYPWRIYKKQRPNGEWEEWKNGRECVCQLKNKRGNAHWQRQWRLVKYWRISWKLCSRARLIQCKQQPMADTPPVFPCPFGPNCGSVSNIINWLATHDAVANYTQNPYNFHITQTPASFRSHTSFVLLASTFLYLFQVVGIFFLFFIYFFLDFFLLRCTFAAPGGGPETGPDPILHLLRHFICCAQVDPLSFVCALYKKSLVHCAKWE